MTRRPRTIIFILFCAIAAGSAAQEGQNWEVQPRPFTRLDVITDAGVISEVDPPHLRSEGHYDVVVNNATRTITIFATSIEGTTLRYLGTDKKNLADDDSVEDGHQVSIDPTGSRVRINNRESVVRLQVKDNENGSDRIYKLRVWRTTGDNVVTQTPATGQPQITGPALVGQTLRANPGNVADVNGMYFAQIGHLLHMQRNEISYSWRQFREPHQDQNVIILLGGGKTLVVDNDERGKRIAVSMCFKDDLGNRECRTSAPTGPIGGGVVPSSDAPPPTPPKPKGTKGVTKDSSDLTARLEGVPAQHDGKKQLTFKLVFSKEVYTGDEALDKNRAVRQALTVSGARVLPAGRVNREQFDAYWIKLKPDGPGPITIALEPPAGQCTAHTAACTPEGQALRERVEATVAGPATISVGDDTVVEAQGATLDFEVTLSEKASHEISVHYKTKDVQAEAGSDYASTTGVLTFAPGETAKTVTVEVFEDAHDEPSETMKLKLSKASGGYLLRKNATGTITNTGAMPRAWNVRVARTVGEQITDAARNRLTGPREPGTRVSVAGLAPWHKARAGETELRQQIPRQWSREEWSAREPAARRLTTQELLTGTSFSLGASPREGTHLGLWGGGAISSFAGREDELSIEGDVATAMLGADWATRDWTWGALLARSMAEGSYGGADDGKMKSDLTGLYPYASRDLTERVSVWGVTGYAEGTVSLTPQGRRKIETDTDLVLVAGGVRGVLLPAPEQGGPELAAVSDALRVRTTSDAVTGTSEQGGSLGATSARASRVRLGLEGTWSGLQLASGDFEPRMEIAFRQDGGDAETGTGVDMGGGLTWTDRAQRLRLALSGRALLIPEAEGYQDRGLSGSINWDPQPQTKRGLSLTLAHRLGGQASGGMDALFGRQTFASLASAGDSQYDSGHRVNLNIDYGLSGFGAFTATPGLELGLSPTARQYTLGWRLGLVRHDPMSLEVRFEASRREPIGEVEAENGVGVSVTGRW